MLIEHTNTVLLIFVIILISGLWIYIIYEKIAGSKKDEEVKNIKLQFVDKQKADSKTISSLRQRVRDLENQISNLTTAIVKLEEQNNVFNENAIGLNRIAQEHKRLKSELERKGIQAFVDEKEGSL